MSDPLQRDCGDLPDTAPPKGLARVGLIAAGTALLVVAGGVYVRTRES